MRNFFVFIGKSGSGKGTQAELLKKYLQEKNPDLAIVWFGIGKHFRELAKGEGYTEKIVREYLEKGALTPEFLAIHIWSHFFIENLKGDEDIILDGTPRKLNEVHVLDGAFEFYGGNVVVLHIDVGEEWAMERLLRRGRFDDKKEEIKKRLNWFEKEVMPVVEFYKNHQKHTFLNMNGEQTIKEVHAEIIEKLKM